MNIVDRVKQLADNKGIKITDIEEACDLPVKSIYKWNKNKPSIDRVIKVAEYLRVDVGYLLGTTEYKTKFEEWDAKYNNNGEMRDKVKQIEAVDTIAAHLEDKEITDEKIKALTQYMDLLFDKKLK